MSCSGSGSQKPNQKPVLVQTSKGPIKGYTCHYENIKFYSFCRIPYAHFPEGELQFAPPKEIESWPNWKELRSHRKQNSEENPLVLNIHTPEIKRPEDNNNFDRPVIAFVAKVNPYDRDICGPHYLMKENVVVVIIYYRTGLLGFLKFDDPQADAPGDVGLRDIKAALFWVKREIYNFGGCPNNITAYGQGDEATHLHYLLKSSIFQNSFNKAILSSPSESFYKKHWENGSFIGRTVFKRICEILELSHITYENDLKSIQFLRSLPFDVLTMISKTVKTQNLRVKDGDDIRFLSLIYEYQAKMPIIIGYNSQEFSLRGFKENIKNFTLSDLNKLLEDFHGTKLTKDFCKDLNTTACKLASDLFFNVGIMAVTRSLTRSMSPKNVYLYRFGANLNNEGNTNMDEGEGARHSDELHYIFKTQCSTNLTEDSLKAQVVKRMTKLWTQFARTGDPNPPEQNKLFKDKWIPIGKKLSHCFAISNSDVEYCEIPETLRMKYLEANYYKVPFFSLCIEKKQESKIKGG